MKPTKIC